MLFDSLVKSNPKHAPGWIAAACLEEHAGRMVAARKLIKAGCEQCPKSDDVWLEAARLHVRELWYSLCIVADIPSRIMTMQKSFLPTLFNMLARASRSGLQQPTSNKMLNRRNVSCVKVCKFSSNPQQFTHIIHSTREYSQLRSAMEGNCQS